MLFLLPLPNPNDFTNSVPKPITPALEVGGEKKSMLTRVGDSIGLGYEGVETYQGGSIGYSLVHNTFLSSFHKNLSQEKRLAFGNTDIILSGRPPMRTMPPCPSGMLQGLGAAMGAVQAGTLGCGPLH